MEIPHAGPLDWEALEYSVSIIVEPIFGLTFVIVTAKFLMGDFLNVIF